MKSLLIGLISVVFFFSQSAVAGHDSRYYDYGRVVKVIPVYHKTHGHYSHHKRDCYRSYKGHYSSQHKEHNPLATVTGAVVGGVIGNKLGKGSRNRDVATVAGALVGGVIGHELGDNHHTHTRHSNKRYYDRHCEYSSHHKRHDRRLKGYEVTYRYKGERFTTFTHEHPGRKIRLQVHLTPMYK